MNSINNILIEVNNISDNRNMGIYLTSISSNNINIINNEFISNNGRGMLLVGINIIIKNNTIYNQLDAGIDIYDANNVTIQENRINNTTRRSGIMVTRGNDIEIFDNNISNIVGYQATAGEYCFAIFIQNTSDIIIQQNTINNVSRIGLNYYGGIFVDSPLTYSNITISNNKITMAQLNNTVLAYGIFSNCFNSTIEYNEIYTILYGIRIDGLNSSILFNKINNYSTRNIFTCYKYYNK